MKLAEEFRQNAEEWRQLEGLAATDVHRRRIAEVANTWLAWAERRERVVTAGDRKAGVASGPGHDVTGRILPVQVSGPEISR